MVVTSRERLEGKTTTAATPSGPDPKSGDLEEGASLSTEDRKRAEEIEETLDALEGKDGSLARHRREALEDELESLQT